MNIGNTIIANNNIHTPVDIYKDNELNFDKHVEDLWKRNEIKMYNKNKQRHVVMKCFIISGDSLQ